LWVVATRPVAQNGLGLSIPGATSRERLMQALREVRGSQRVTTQNPAATYEALERYGLDLTKLAGQGKLDPVNGRDEEIRRAIQVLSRRTKNNRISRTAVTSLRGLSFVRTPLLPG
jgi:ATP-dependent Clp protease ATP-binding subunit ClpA